jgi:DNA-binding CsgD family transcriptional regulator
MEAEAFAEVWAAGEAMPLQEAVTGISRSAPAPTLDRAPARSSAAAAVASLTRREREVLDLLGEGRADRVIGQILSIKPSTVTTHIGHVLDKLGVRSRTAAAAIAILAGGG